MIELYDIVQIKLEPQRKAMLSNVSQSCQRLAAADGQTMRVVGIHHLQETEDRRSFVLEKMEQPSIDTDVYAARADFEFIQHGLPPKHLYPVGVLEQAPAGTNAQKQLDLFGGWL